MQQKDLGWWIDHKLLDYVSSKITLIDANYYVGRMVIPMPGRTNIQALTYMGYSLVTRDLRACWDDSTYRQKANLDINR